MTKSSEIQYITSNTEPHSVADPLAETDPKRPDAAVERQFGLNELTTSLTERSAVSPLGAHEPDGDSTRGNYS